MAFHGAESGQPLCKQSTIGITSITQIHTLVLIGHTQYCTVMLTCVHEALPIGQSWWADRHLGFRNSPITVQSRRGPNHLSVSILLPDAVTPER